MKHASMDKVAAFIKEQGLFPPKTPILVAVSGGVDSMVGLDILHGLSYPLGVAHCNFKLRGEASDADQVLVRERAASMNLPFFTMDFDTGSVASADKLSIQEAARNLRYAWLEEIRLKEGYHFIVTAHHQQDNAETVLYNLVKNTGLRGLHGIWSKREQIARPLLCLTRQEILQYAADFKVKFREDASNASVKYSRNFLRQNVLPQLEQLNPQAVQAIHGLSRKAAEAEILMDERLAQIRKKILVRDNGSLQLKFRYLLQHAAGRTILYELLKEFGFNEDQCEGIFDALLQRSGLEFLSATHRLLKDRNSLYIQDLREELTSLLQFDKIPDQIRFNNFKIQVREAPVEKVNIRRDAGYAYFDLDKIELPLKVRYWKKGDYFYPFGLSRDRSDKPGKKKLSKYFKDEKISIHDKERTPVLFSGEHLIWLVGHRIDHRFRITETTTQVLKMKVIGN